MLAIRLNKQNKTIKIVNKDGNLRLTRDEKTIKVVNRRENLRLQHTGKTGPQGAQGEQGLKGDKGDTGDTGVSTFVRAHHMSDASFARPNALYVEWVGNVAPLNATTEDTWIRTP